LKTLLGSASILDRVLECPASNLLPQTAPLHPNAKAAGDFGTAVHAVLEGVEPEQQYKEELEDLPIAKTVAPLCQPHNKELAMVWRGEDGKCEVLGNGLGRDYGVLGPKDVTGTADVVLTGYRTVEVIDYKTGKSIPDPEESAQLKHLALMAVKALRPAAEVVVGVFQRVRIDGRKKQADRWVVKDEVAVFDRVTLDLHERRLKKALVEAEKAKAAIDSGETPEVKEGKYCFFCPARLECPAKKGMR
jgi:CRISPR/Cas system-associated exonuclease Cas4 (RecB family)